jgi:hypothetical protein
VTPSDSAGDSAGPVPAESSAFTPPGGSAAGAEIPEPAGAEVPAFAGLAHIENTAAPEPAQEPVHQAHAKQRLGVRAGFRRWRRTRPFWGGLLIAAAGGEILFTEKAPLGVVLHIGTQGVAGLLLPAMMILCGLLLWFAPAQRTFYSILSVLLALGTWITSNLGGFFIGFLLGIVGGSMAFGWSPSAGRRPAKAKRKAKRNPAVTSPPNGAPTG